MSEARFSVAYDGPAVKSGTMDVKDLASALLAVGQLFDAANMVLNTDKTTVSVNVHATGEGSFEVFLEVVQGKLNQLVELFSGDQVTAALQLKELVLVGGASAAGGLIWLVKKLRGRVPDKLERINENQFRITVDSETFEVPVALLRLYQDLPVRVALEALVREPLKKEGIETFEVRGNKGVQQSVSRNESEFFARPDIPEEILVEDTRTAAFSIVSLAFKDDNKWRLYDGNAPISALITDEAFLYKVNSNQISFAKGDVLICRVKMVQTSGRNGLKAEYIVEHVVEHKPAIRQMSLQLETFSHDDPDGRNGRGK